MHPFFIVSTSPSHEIGHIVLGHTESGDRSDIDEYAAERFAIGILAPACVLWGLNIPELKLCEMTRINYQQLINSYAETHERQTTMDFHHQIKCAILDAVDEGLIARDPTHKAIIKGKTPREKKPKYLNQFELHTMLNHLNLTPEISWDWFILLVAKTGMRFSEVLALTPKDFDFPHQTLSISKTWDYKNGSGFLPTKNRSSVRKIQIDWQTVIQFSGLVRGLPEDKPIFAKNGKKIYNATVNDILERHCKRAEVPVISIHGLRHTHASLLLFAGVSIASVTPSWSCKYDNNAEDLFTYHTGTRK